MTEHHPLGRKPVIHELKTWPEFFREISEGRKSFECRKDDRDYHVGDTLYLREFDPVFGVYTGQMEVAKVTYIMRGGQFGLEAGYCVMSLNVTSVRPKPDKTKTPPEP